MSLTAEEQAYFDAIDEMPMRRGGGFIVSIDGSKPAPKKGVEFRSREQAERRSPEAFPRLRRAQNLLEILTYQLEREERE
jgi:hypothetical protein